MRLLIMFLMAIWLLQPALARDLGQWQDSDPVTKEWYKTLMRPDYPEASCCGEADAYWADVIEVVGDKVYAVITDPRDDAPLKRSHIDIGTRIEVPKEKLKWDRANPTGHNVIFLGSNNFVFCFVQSTGT